MALGTPVSFRPTPELRVRLEQVRTTFPEDSWSAFFTWLFEQERVRDLLRERLSQPSAIAEAIMNQTAARIAAGQRPEPIDVGVQSSSTSSMI